MFSASFLQFLIVMALLWTTTGALALILLLIRDWKNKTLW
tara:strand:+ start:3687 stop:3806 length:120 start_codon:yes stop_codon:yes gene_type:complete